MDDTYNVQEYVSQSLRWLITKIAHLHTLIKILRILFFTFIANFEECNAEYPVKSFVASCFIMPKERYKKKGEPCPLFDIFIWPVFDFIPWREENYQYESDKHSYVESYVALETSMVPTRVTVFKQEISIRDFIWRHCLIWIHCSSIREKIWQGIIIKKHILVIIQNKTFFVLTTFSCTFPYTLSKKFSFRPFQSQKVHALIAAHHCIRSNLLTLFPTSWRIGSLLAKNCSILSINNLRRILWFFFILIFWYSLRLYCCLEPFVFLLNYPIILQF